MATPGQPSPEQIAAMKQQFAAEAEKRGMTPEEFGNMQRQQLANEAAKQGLTSEQYIEKLKAQALEQHQQKLQAAKAGAPQKKQQQVPVNAGGTPDPKALAVANFLRSQDLKARTCILDGRRKELFKGNQPHLNPRTMKPGENN